MNSKYMQRPQIAQSRDYPLNEGKETREGSMECIVCHWHRKMGETMYKDILVICLIW